MNSAHAQKAATNKIPKCNNQKISSQEKRKSTQIQTNIISYLQCRLILSLVHPAKSLRGTEPKVKNVADVPPAVMADQPVLALEFGRKPSWRREVGILDVQGTPCLELSIDSWRECDLLPGPQSKPCIDRLPGPPQPCTFCVSGTAGSGTMEKRQGAWRSTSHPATLYPYGSSERTEMAL
jgi:hypothetical protein